MQKSKFFHFLSRWRRWGTCALMLMCMGIPNVAYSLTVNSSDVAQNEYEVPNNITCQMGRELARYLFANYPSSKPDTNGAPTLNLTGNPYSPDVPASTRMTAWILEATDAYAYTLKESIDLTEIAIELKYVYGYLITTQEYIDVVTRMLTSAKVNPSIMLQGLQDGFCSCGANKYMDAKSTGYDSMPTCVPCPKNYKRSSTDKNQWACTCAGILDENGACVMCPEIQDRTGNSVSILIEDGTKCYIDGTGKFENTRGVYQCGLDRCYNNN